ncbi:MAG: C40 family peptidase [Candidatus Nealsonbacteria bacterium]|nr:C40 family peptidase [Candidatus Nealsonbacteria bacterium]
MNRKEKLTHIAIRYLGRPYKYGAKSAEAPNFFDCSSFVQYIYKKIDINLPRASLEQAHYGRKINFKKQKIEVGDLMFFKGTVGRYNPEFPQGIGHVAMYIGNNKIIQAKYQKNKDGSDGGQVQIDKAEKLLRRKDLVVIKRMILK